MRALYVAGIGKSERQSPGSVVPFEQLGVCNVSVFYLLDEAAFYIVLSDYVFEKHRIFFLIVFSVYCLFPCHSERTRGIPYYHFVGDSSFRLRYVQNDSVSEGDSPTRNLYVITNPP